MAKEIVTPGELLGMEEEFFGNEKTFAEEGSVYSLVLGEKKMLNKQVQVVSPKFARQLQKDDIVVGRVEDLYDSVALIVIQSGDELERLANAPKAGVSAPEADERKAIGKTYTYLRITEIAKNAGYIENFRQFIKIGDIVRAKVIDVAPLGTYLTIAEEKLGVIKARCSRCRAKLTQQDRAMRCLECGNTESRKMAGSK
ncbi:MAG: hypothetical protein ABIG96_02805 [Candidatus Micrarchaeota archaeon]